MAGESILLVGKNPATEELVFHLSSGGWQIASVREIDEATEQLEHQEYDVVIVDAESAGAPPWLDLDALNVIENPVVLVVPPGSSMAAFDGRPFRPKGFVTKPIDRAALHMMVESVLVFNRLLQENNALKRQLGSAVNLSDWIGCTPESQKVRNSIATAAFATDPVLLLGENGVVERVISIASAAKFDGTTLPDYFCAPPSLTVPEPARFRSVSLRELIADIEKRIIVQTLDGVDGSQKKAAERLRLNPTTLHEKMKRYKIIPERHRNRPAISA